MTVHATTINKVCLSGLQTIYLADLMIRAGEADVIIAGGMESMTNAPYLLPGARAGYRLGDQKVVDSMMFDGLTCAFDHCAMGLATERYNQGRISRARQDEFSARSHQLAAAAIAVGPFRRGDRRVPGRPATRASPSTCRPDEGVRGETTVESLAAVARRLREGRHHHRRQRLADLRRRGGVARHVARSAPINSVSRRSVSSSATARSPVPTPHCSPNPRTRSSRRRRRPTSTCGASTSSRSTKPSRPWDWPRRTTSASSEERINVNGGAIALGPPHRHVGHTTRAHRAHGASPTRRRCRRGGVVRWRRSGRRRDLRSL